MVRMHDRWINEIERMLNEIERLRGLVVAAHNACCPDRYAPRDKDTAA